MKMSNRATCFRKQTENKKHKQQCPTFRFYFDQLASNWVFLPLGVELELFVRLIGTFSAAGTIAATLEIDPSCTWESCQPLLWHDFFFFISAVVRVSETPKQRMKHLSSSEPGGHLSTRSSSCAVRAPLLLWSHALHQPTQRPPVSVQLLALINHSRRETENVCSSESFSVRTAPVVLF